MIIGTAITKLMQPTCEQQSYKSRIALRNPRSTESNVEIVRCAVSSLFLAFRD